MKLNNIKNYIQRSVSLYIILGVILTIATGEKRIAANFLAYTKDFAHYVLKYSIYQDSNKPENFKKAILYYQTLLQYLPSPALVYNNMGFCYFYLQDMEMAVQSYQKAALLEPEFYSIYYDLGLIAMALKEIPLSIDLFHTSLKYLPEKKEDLIKLLNVPTARGAKNILKHFDSIRLRARYDKEQIHLHLAALYLDAKEYEKMRNISLKGIEAFPTSVEMYFNTGTANFYLKDYQKAVFFLSAAIKLAPNFAEAYYYRAKSLQALGQDLPYLADMKKTRDINQNGWKRPTPNFRELHLYPDSTIFFKAYSLEKKSYSLNAE